MKINKYLYGWKFYCHYGQGWEYECFETSYTDMKINRMIQEAQACIY